MTIWKELSNIHRKTRKATIAKLFDDDPARFNRFSASLGSMVYDYSKVRITDEIRDLLLGLLEESNVAARRDAMFEGKRINLSENRAVLHTALRNRSEDPLVVEGHDVMPAIRDTLARMGTFADAIRDGSIAAADGEPFADVINIGIGGSDLGPAMATLALAPYHDGPRAHYVSNVDGAHIHDTLKTLDPARTLVVIASKTFTTAETMANAGVALKWLEKALGKQAASKHLAAVSSAPEKTKAFGIAKDRVFGFEDWVGGRYSIWGPVGLPLMIAIGPENFGKFLDGAYGVDQHFLTAEPQDNIPMLMAAVGIWHRNICGFDTRAVLPYEQRLSRLPAYLQQLDMESNGKRIATDDTRVARQTGPIVWGEPGTNGQHAFYQLIHQGTSVVPCEFLVAANGHEPELADMHDMLVANCLAQSEALARGRTFQEMRRSLTSDGVTENLATLAMNKSFPGNRPSTTLLFDKLTPEVLGQIIALYEHRVFVEGVVWGINSFDQWGVELGKELANQMLPMVKSGKSEDGVTGSTSGLVGKLAKLRR